MKGRTRYSQGDKTQYIQACQRYNLELENLREGKNHQIVAASLELQTLKGRVPKAWRWPAFIQRQGAKQ